MLDGCSHSHRVFYPCSVLLCRFSDPYGRMDWLADGTTRARARCLGASAVLVIKGPGGTATAGFPGVTTLRDALLGGDLSSGNAMLAARTIRPRMEYFHQCPVDPETHAGQEWRVCIQRWPHAARHRYAAPYQRGNAWPNPHRINRPCITGRTHRRSAQPVDDDPGRRAARLHAMRVDATAWNAPVLLPWGAAPR